MAWRLGVLVDGGGGVEYGGDVLVRLCLLDLVVRV